MPKKYTITLLTDIRIIYDGCSDLAYFDEYIQFTDMNGKRVRSTCRYIVGEE